MKRFLNKLMSVTITGLLAFAPLRAEAPAEVPALTDVRAQSDSITLEMSQLMPYDVFTLSNPWRLVIEVPGTVYKTAFTKKDVASGLIRRVRGYQFKENPLISRVVVDLRSAVDYKATANGNQVVVSLKKNALAAQPAAGAAEDTPSPIKKSSEAKATGHKRDLLNSLPKEQITLDFEGADIRDVIRLMAETSNINIIFGPEVSGNISIHLKQVPFDEAFSTILNLKGLVASQLGENILRVTTPDVLQRERLKAVVYTKTIPINYLKAEEMQKHIQAVMASAGRKGTITVAEESNSIVITDSEEGLAEAERLIAQLDKKPRQVMIEARIVEVNLDNGLDVGVQWEFANADVKRNADGSIKQQNNIGYINQDGTDARIKHIATDAAGNQTTFGAATPANGTGVSLAGAGATNAAIAFGFVKNNQILDVSLSALVSQSKAKILAAPKVVTINGQQAKIEAVQDIRFQTATVSNGVVTSDFKTVSAGIVLNVTPTINAEDRITLRIQPESSFPQGASGGAPIIRTRTAQTTVIVKDGDTLVIGGLIDDSDTKDVQKVPVLGDIPIIGVFFRSQTNRKVRNELLVFVTPRIVRD